jgi:inosine/xanthosine triphosphate pyrophosphatase family protein
MHRAVTGDRLVIATHNPGKLREIADLLTTGQFFLTGRIGM